MNRLFLKVAATAALTLAIAGPDIARAQDVHSYDGYCYVKRADAEHSGAIVGAIAGGVIGSNVASRGDRGTGTVVGALLGAAVGSSVDNDRARDLRCYHDRYYTYEGTSYYDPAVPPPGYVVMYYPQRPQFSYDYTTYRYDRRPDNYYQTQWRRQVAFNHAVAVQRQREVNQAHYYGRVAANEHRAAVIEAQHRAQATRNWRRSHPRGY